jgi:uncharacterized RDD family membrane protein YckC
MANRAVRAVSSARRVLDMAEQADGTIAGGPGQAVRAPEQVWLELAIAGPTARMLAYAADYVLIVLLQVALFALVVLGVPSLVSRFPSVRDAVRAVRTGHGAELVFVLVAVFLIGQLVIEWGYFLFWETVANGRSPGKGLVGLRVVRDDGFPIGFRDALVRNLLRAVDLLPWYYTVGLVAMLVSVQGKRLGDVAAGTIVVRLDRPESAPPLDLEPDAAGVAFRFSRAQLALVGAAELALLRQTLRRLDVLAPEQRAVILERAVTALVKRIDHGPVAADERHEFLRALLRARLR